MFVVIAGLDPAIDSVTARELANAAEWMPGSSPGMTTGVCFGFNIIVQ
jgi:hypothetical protein